MARQEMELWDIEFQNETEIYEDSMDIEEEARELGEFLEDTPINFIGINCVIPSTRFGIIYTATIGRLENHDTAREVIVSGNGFTFDNRVLDCLELGLAALNSKEKRQALMVKTNLHMIQDTVLDSFNWPTPFNTRADN